MLSVHYRHPINYSKGLVEDAQAGMERIRTAYGNVKHRLEHSAGLGDHNDIWLAKIEAIKQEFIETMDDDFNTANAISKLFDLSKLANTYLLEKQTAEPVLQTFIDVFDELAGVLGLPFAQSELLDAEIEALLEERIEARKNRDFARSDEIRDHLREQNIILEDTAQGTRWKRG